MKDREIWERVVDSLHDEPKCVDVELTQANEYKIAKRILNSQNEVLKLKGISHMDSAWEKVDRALRQSSMISVFLKYAAIIILALSLGSVATYYVNLNLISSDRYTSIEVPYGQSTKVILSDSTEIWLNSGSVLKYPNEFNRKERLVFLDGEGFFEVTKNAHLPFVIKTNRFQVKVLGTSFNLSTYKEDQINSLVLLNGKVDLLSNDGEIVGHVKPGEMTEEKGGVFSVKKVDTSFYSSWKEGRQVFDKVPLLEITKKLERWYNVKIEIQDESLNNISFSGTFLRYKPIDQIFQAIRLLIPIDYTITINSDTKNLIKVFKKRS